MSRASSHYFSNGEACERGASTLASFDYVYVLAGATFICRFRVQKRIFKIIVCVAVYTVIIRHFFSFCSNFSWYYCKMSTCNINDKRFLHQQPLFCVSLHSTQCALHLQAYSSDFYTEATLSTCANSFIIHHLRFLSWLTFIAVYIRTICNSINMGLLSVSKVRLLIDQHFQTAAMLYDFRSVFRCFLRQIIEILLSNVMISHFVLSLS